MKEKISASQRALNLWAIILIIWSIYRANFKMPEWFDEFIAKPFVFILPVYYYIKIYEKQNFFEALNISKKNLKPEIIFSLLIGIIFFTTALIANLVKFKKIVLIDNILHNSQQVLFIFLISIATAISEEILSRGFILKRLYLESKNVVSASFAAAALFLILHFPIIFTDNRIRGSLLIIFMFIDFTLGLINSFVFLERKNLILPILIHAFYNTMLSFLII